MNRRRFLRLLGIAPVGVVAVPLVAGHPIAELTPIDRWRLAYVDEMVARAMLDDAARDSPMSRGICRRFSVDPADVGPVSSRRWIA